MSKLRELSKGSAIYGSGDVAVQILNFLLLPLYVVYLSKADYGVIALLADRRSAGQAVLPLGSGRRLHALLVRLRRRSGAGSAWPARCSSSCSR